MSRTLNRLPPNAATSITKPGRHSDGGNLYLVIDKDGRRRNWSFLYVFAGKQREAGLGATGAVTLKGARLRAAEMRARLAAGLDPLAERKRTAPVPVPTFGEAADTFFATHEGSWTNAKHRRQVIGSVKMYCGSIAKTPVDQIDTEAILKVLRPVWARAPETASRLRGRIEAVLDAARALGHIDADKANPARWRGHLDKLLPERSKLSRGHYTALPYAEVPAFVARLRALDTVGALALEFTILTATRTGEALGARVEEFDLVNKVWTVPPQRVKTRAAHRVPLSPRAVEIVEQLRASHTGNFIFPGRSPGSPLSHVTMLNTIKRLGFDATVHGFRSAFRDWAGNETNTPREIAEQSLGHQVGSAVELAYRRSDALERRRALMLAWDRYCEGGSNVVELHREAV